jgi:drug/metabolite transporter (DMT)-like permease
MWIVLSLVASMLWGLVYVLDEQILRSISVPSSLAITFLFAAVASTLLAYYSGNLHKDLEVMVSSDRLLRLVAIQVVVFVVAELAIGLAISRKDATLSGLVEISYPVFTALFAFLLFKEKELNLGTMFAAVLILIGISLIYYINR